MFLKEMSVKGGPDRQEAGFLKIAAVGFPHGNVKFCYTFIQFIDFHVFYFTCELLLLLISFCRTKCFAKARNPAIVRTEEGFGFALPALLAHFKRIYLSVFRFLFVNYGKIFKEKNSCGIWSFSIWKSHKYRADLFEVFSSFILTSPFTFLSLICSQDQAQSISYFNFFSGPSAQISSTCYLSSVCCGFTKVQV